MNALRTYDYLLKSREKLLAAVRTCGEDEYRRGFAFGLKTIGATVTHLLTSEWYYAERLAGRVVPAYETWPIREESPPEFGVVEAAWRAQGARVREQIAGERDWTRRIEWLGFPDAQGRRFHIGATAGDFFTQLALHEVHHRAQVMAMLREIGRPLEDIDYNALMFDRRPAE